MIVYRFKDKNDKAYIFGNRSVLFDHSGNFTTGDEALAKSLVAVGSTLVRGSEIDELTKQITTYDQEQIKKQWNKKQVIEPKEEKPKAVEKEKLFEKVEKPKPEPKEEPKEEKPDARRSVSDVGDGSDRIPERGRKSKGGSGD